MGKRTLISITILISILTIWSIFELKKHNANTGFSRSYKFSNLQRLCTFNSVGTLKEIAGGTTHTVFIATSTPGKILVINLDLNQLSTIILTLGEARHVITFVDSPGIVFLKGVPPEILSSRLYDTTIERHMINGNAFTRAAVIDQNTYVLRQYASHIREQIFSLYNRQNGSFKTGINKGIILEDGGVLTDGTLLYQKNSGRILYVYFHKGVFDCLDTNLNLMYTTKTIDTVTSFNNSVVRYDSKTSVNYTFGRPLETINKTACANDGLLFICSLVKANNEDVDSYNKNSNIDIYDLNSFKYISSFKIPDYNKEKLKGMKIIGNNLIVIYPHAVSLFVMPPNLS